MAPNSWTPTATKTFVPLESNPDVFTALLRELGVVDRGLVFEDVFALDEPGFLPRPALALVAVFPSDRWDAAAAAGAATEASIDGGVSPATGANGSTEETEYTGSGAAEPIMWFRQTIHNACGLYAVLHALANGPAREMLGTSVDRGGGPHISCTQQTSRHDKKN